MNNSYHKETIYFLKTTQLTRDKESCFKRQFQKCSRCKFSWSHENYIERVSMGWWIFRLTVKIGYFTANNWFLQSQLNEKCLRLTFFYDLETLCAFSGPSLKKPFRLIQSQSFIPPQPASWIMFNHAYLILCWTCGALTPKILHLDLGRYFSLHSLTDSIRSKQASFGLFPKSPRCSQARLALLKIN